MNESMRLFRIPRSPSLTGDGFHVDGKTRTYFIQNFPSLVGGYHVWRGTPLFNPGSAFIV